MVIGLDQWRDGIGYDMKAFVAMRADEQEAVVNEIRSKGKGNLDWRDMEVLGFENSSESFDRLRDELVGGSADNRAKALRELNAAGRMTASVFDNKLAQVLDDVAIDDGLTQALMLAADEAAGERTRAALERGVRERPRVALHFAAALLDLAGLGGPTTAGFNPRFRPTLLKLLPDEPAASREAAIAQVFAWLEEGRR
jgi:hypothetical protein